MDVSAFVSAGKLAWLKLAGQRNGHSQGRGTGNAGTQSCTLFLQRLNCTNGRGHEESYAATSSHGQLFVLCLVYEVWHDENILTIHSIFHSNNASFRFNGKTEYI